MVLHVGLKAGDAIEITSAYRRKNRSSNATSWFGSLMAGGGFEDVFGLANALGVVSPFRTSALHNVNEGAHRGACVPQPKL